MGRPKTIHHKDKPTITRDQVQRPGPSKPLVASTSINSVNSVVGAIQANAATLQAEEHSITPEDFKAPVEAITEPQSESKPEELEPGNAERQRVLNLLHGKYGKDSKEKKTVIVANQKQSADILTELKINQNIMAVQTKLAEQNKPAGPKMTLDHYKTLKDLERFWTPFKLHGILMGLNSRELDALEKVMREVFEPNYKTDFWCPYCIGEFLKDLYTYFEKWQENQKEEMTGYDTILKEDKF